MQREFIYTRPFQESWKKMGLEDDDLKELENILLKEPLKGDVIQGTGGARKLRIQLQGRGKSSGGRVIYLDIFEKEKLYLLLAYPKSAQNNLTPAQAKVIKDWIEAIKRE